MTVKMVVPTLGSLLDIVGLMLTENAVLRACCQTNALDSVDSDLENDVKARVISTNRAVHCASGCGAEARYKRVKSLPIGHGNIGEWRAAAYLAA